MVVKVTCHFEDKTIKDMFSLPSLPPAHYLDVDTQDDCGSHCQRRQSLPQPGSLNILNEAEVFLSPDQKYLHWIGR